MKRNLLLCLLLPVLACSMLTCCSSKDSAQQETAVDLGGTVIYSDNGITLTARSLTAQSEQHILLLDCENKNDFAVGFWSSQTAVNHVTVNCYLQIDVEANSTAELPLTLYDDSLQEAGITTVSSLELTLYIDNLDEGTELDYTPILRLSLPTEDDNSPAPTGTVLAQTEQLQVSSLGLRQDGNAWYVSVLIENNSEATVLVNAGQITVDGQTDRSAYMAEEVLPGTIRYGRIHLSAESVADSVSFVLTISDFSTWEQLFQTQTLTVEKE